MLRSRSRRGRTATARYTEVQTTWPWRGSREARRLTAANANANVLLHAAADPLRHQRALLGGRPAGGRHRRRRAGGAREDPVLELLDLGLVVEVDVDRSVLAHPGRHLR